MSWGFPPSLVAMSEPPLKKLRTDSDCAGDGALEAEGRIIPSGRAAKESDVGISEYMSDHEGFFAVLKRKLVI